MVFTQFLRLQSVDKADAQHIASAITKAASSGLGVEEEVWRGRLVGVGSDGAAVMVGRKSGVVTRLSDGLPHVLGVHCMAHRLELSFKDVAKKNLCHKKLDTLLLGLYYFYHNSPLNRANLKASYQSLQKSPLMPTRVGGTRWVSHILKALDHFVRGYAPIVQHLEQIQSPDSVGIRGEQKAKAKHFYQTATTKSVVKYACLLFDVLQHLSTLSCSLQRSSISLAQVHRYLEATKAVLTRYKSKPGPMLKQIEEKASFEGIESLQGLMHLLLHHIKVFLMIFSPAWKNVWEISNRELFMQQRLWILLPGQTSLLPMLLEMMRSTHWLSILLLCFKVLVLTQLRCQMSGQP